MNKCINCAYFLNCENANEEQTCEKYKFIRKEIIKNERVKKRNFMSKMFGVQ